MLSGDYKTILALPFIFRDDSSVFNFHNPSTRPGGGADLSFVMKSTRAWALIDVLGLIADPVFTKLNYPFQKSPG